MENLSNIQKSVKNMQKHKKYLLNVIFTNARRFANFYHMPNNFNTEKLFILAKAGKLQLPIGSMYRSKSTAANFIKNMKYKGQVLDLATACHYIYNDISLKTIKKLAKCHSKLSFAMGTDVNGKRRHHILKNGSFRCDFKYCPNREKYTAWKRFNTVYTMLKAMNAKYGYVPIFITLTIPPTNPKPSAVKKVIQKLTKSWKNMYHEPLFNGNNKKKGILKGFIFKIEHTYNNMPSAIAYGLLHYHSHIIGIVRKSYLEKYGAKYFVKQSQWQAYWEHAWGWNYKKHPLKKPYIDKHGKSHKFKHLLVSVEAPYYKDKDGNKITLKNAKTPEDKDKIIKKASEEVAKYTSKSSDYGKMPQLHKKITRKTIDLNVYKQRQKKASSLLNQYRKDIQKIKHKEIKYNKLAEKNPQKAWEYDNDINLEYDYTYRFYIQEKYKILYNVNITDYIIDKIENIWAKYKEHQINYTNANYQIDSIILPFIAKQRSNNKKIARRKEIKKELNPRQLKAVKAFHAVYKGEKNQKLFIFGGICAKFKKKYENGELDDWKDKKPETTYSYKIISTYQYHNKFKDYLDQKTELSEDDITELKDENLQVAEPSTNSKVTLRSNPSKERFTEKIS